jgi:hypothetical protein
MDLKEQYEIYFDGLDSRFRPKFLSISEETNGSIKLVVEETFKEHSIRSAFFYNLSDDFLVHPIEIIDYDSDVSEESIRSINSFDSVIYAPPDISADIIETVCKKDLDSRKWTYMVPLEDWAFCKRSIRSIALPRIESL